MHSDTKKARLQLHSNNFDFLLLKSFIIKALAYLSLKI